MVLSHYTQQKDQCVQRPSLTRQIPTIAAGVRGVSTYMTVCYIYTHADQYRTVMKLTTTLCRIETAIHIQFMQLQSHAELVNTSTSREPSLLYVSTARP